MASSFSVSIRDPKSALTRVRRAIEKHGGVVDGDLRNGGTFTGDTIMGRIEGRFRYLGGDGNC